MKLLILAEIEISKGEYNNTYIYIYLFIYLYIIKLDVLVAGFCLFAEKIEVFHVIFD